MHQRVLSGGCQVGRFHLGELVLVDAIRAVLIEEVEGVAERRRVLLEERRRTRGKLRRREPDGEPTALFERRGELEGRV